MQEIVIHNWDELQRAVFDDVLSLIHIFRSVNVDYYTDADLNTSVKVLDVLKEQPLGEGTLAYGEVLVTWLVTMFKKFKLDTQETLGFGPVDLPELEMPTNACWWALDAQITSGLSMDDLQGGMLGIANALRQICLLYTSDYPTPDGTGVRDYIHVVDLARGHVAAADFAMKHTGTEIINLGTGHGYSVLDLSLIHIF